MLACTSTSARGAARSSGPSLAIAASSARTGRADAHPGRLRTRDSRDGSPHRARRAAASSIVLKTQSTPPHVWGLFLSVSPLRHKAKRLARGYIAAHNVAARVDPERAGGCRSGEVDGDVVSVQGLDKTVEPGRVMLYAGDLVRGVHVPCSREITARDDE